ncbi:MAG: hypothetical protein ACM3VZ_02780 [Acidobacteriota bacterium]
MDHPDVGQQISETEQRIDAGNERMRQLRSSLGPATRQAVRRQGKVLLIGAVVSVAIGLVLYPRRHALMRGLHKLTSHPLGKAALDRLPMVGAVLPLLQGGKSAMQKGVVMTALPWLFSWITSAARRQGGTDPHP